METGERADETIVREVKEETGYDTEVVRLVGVYSDPEHTTITIPMETRCTTLASCSNCV